MLRRQDSSIPVSGSIVESDPTPTVSSLVQNTAALPNSSTIPISVPFVGSSAGGVTSTSVPQSPTPSANSASVSTGHEIPLATVIGACVAALILLLLAVLLAIYCSRRQRQFTAHSSTRNSANNVSRRRSHLEPWKRMEDGDQKEAQARPMNQRPQSGLGGMFHRTLSIASGEKSFDGFNRESVGTMQHFAKYHPGLAARMASQGAAADVSAQIVKPPPALRIPTPGSDKAPPVSWDGETAGGDSFFSLHSSLTSSMSPLMMSSEKSTPVATSSSQHHWESAQILRVSQIGPDSSEPGELQNPFSDRASSVRSSSKRGQNPFFSGRDQPVKRVLLPEPPQNPFTDENVPRDSSAALQSLIAALEEGYRPISSDRIVSMQSSVYSRATGDDGESAVSVTAFPYPPTQANAR